MSSSGHAPWALAMRALKVSEERSCSVHSTFKCPIQDQQAILKASVKSVMQRRSCSCVYDRSTTNTVGQAAQHTALAWRRQG